MNIEDIKKIINDAKDNGLIIKVRDVAFVLLKKNIDDDNVCYSTLFGVDYSEHELEEYVNGDKVKYLNKLLRGEETHVKENTANNISFDENRAGIEEDLRYIEKFVKDNEKTLEPKEIAALIGRKSELRVKLNDKFGAAEQKDEQRIVVMTKFSGICEWTNRECPMTRQYAMDKFNLIEKE